jgi:hypothetical protein
MIQAKKYSDPILHMVQITKFLHPKRIMENSNISQCKNIILKIKKKSFKKETKILQNIIITLKLISSFNTSQKKNPHIKNRLIIIIIIIIIT